MISNEEQLNSKSNGKKGSPKKLISRIQKQSKEQFKLLKRQELPLSILKRKRICLLMRKRALVFLNNASFQILQMLQIHLNHLKQLGSYSINGKQNLMKSVVKTGLHTELTYMI